MYLTVWLYFAPLHSATTLSCAVLTAKHEGKYSAKLSKRDEEDLEVEELRRKKSIAERSLVLFV